MTANVFPSLEEVIVLHDILIDERGGSGGLAVRPRPAVASGVNVPGVRPMEYVAIIAKTRFATVPRWVPSGGVAAWV